MAAAYKVVYCRMKISMKSEYALRAIFDLATQPPGELVKAAVIAGRQSITRKLLELILSELKMGGFVCARRGSDGGYRLAKPAGEITVGEVLTFVGEIRPPKRRSPGPFHELWTRVDCLIFDVADNTTFADLAEQWQESQKQFVATWEI
jgi:Rrf2 family transcriptional regulator, cysteine metabolism repressor